MDTFKNQHPNIANFRDGFNLSFMHLNLIIAYYQGQQDAALPLPVANAAAFVRELNKQVAESEKFHCQECGYDGLAKDLLVVEVAGSNPPARDFSCPNCNSKEVQIIAETTDPELLNLYRCRNALQDLVRLKLTKEKEGPTEEYVNSKDAVWKNAEFLLNEALAIEDALSR